MDAQEWRTRAGEVMADWDVVSHEEMPPDPNAAGWNVAAQDPSTTELDQFQMPVRPPGAMPPAREYRNARKIDFLSNIAGAPRAVADIHKDAAELLGLPKWAGTAFNAISPLTLFGSLAPSPSQIGDYLHEKSGLPRA